MTNNTIALNVRDLITIALIEVTDLLGPMPNTDPDFPTLQAANRELSQLNFLVVVDDIKQMADTINQHNADLQKLTQQIQGTTAQLNKLSDRLKQVSEAVTFLIDTAAKAAVLGLL